MNQRAYVDPASLTWDASNLCWTWNGPSGVRFYGPEFDEEYNRAQLPRRARGTRKATVQLVGHQGTWGVDPEVLVPALRAAGRTARERYEELEAARRAIQVQREADQLEGVVVANECAHCGAPPPPRGQPCRYCGTVAQ